MRGRCQEAGDVVTGKKSDVSAAGGGVWVERKGCTQELACTLNWQGEPESAWGRRDLRQRDWREERAREKVRLDKCLGGGRRRRLGQNNCPHCIA